MVFECPRRSARRREEKLSTRTLNTAKEYASNTTIHGFAYVANQEHSVVARAFWGFVVLLAVVVTTFQMASLRNQWETYPVITTLDTIALPIENIEFPAVTICPQGSMKEIMDNVMFQQLRDYITNQTEHHRKRRSTSQGALKNNEGGSSDVTYDEMTRLLEDFLRDVYPGATAGPVELVSMLNSDHPNKLVANKAVVLQNQNEECDEAENQNIVDELNKQLNNDFCPDGFSKLDGTGCVMAVDSQMAYNAAAGYCKDVGGANVLQLNSYGDIEELYQQSILGTWEYTSIYTFIYSLI